MKENDITKVICEYLALKHYFFWRANTAAIYNAKAGSYRAMPKYGKNGVPDIILIVDGKFWGLEVKIPKNKQQQSQIDFQTGCEKAGGRYCVVHSLEEVQALGL